MKVYTIIANFSVGDYDDYLNEECWIANFKNREDAVEAFRFKMKETGCLDADGKVILDGEAETVEELFTRLLSSGCCYDGYEGSERNRWFVRGEEVQEKFGGENIAWH